MSLGTDRSNADAPISRARSTRTIVDDVHASISRTEVLGVERPRAAEDLRMIVEHAATTGGRLTIAGGRHAMGRQAFGRCARLIDTRGMNRVLGLDAENRTIHVEAGIDWPTLVREIRARDRECDAPLSIVQKQTGADLMTLGGSIAVNAHGRGLALAPIGAQVNALHVVEPSGSLVRCTRSHRADLFRHVIGGYGIFGAIASVELQLEERFRVARRVELRTTDGLMEAFAARRTAGYRFGDFQFAVDSTSDDFLRRGVFSCYEPTAEEPSSESVRLEGRDWRELLYLAHIDKRRAFERYAAHYVRTDGQVYESDLHQLAAYQSGYHAEIDERTGASCRGSEVITELYVDRSSFEPFMESLRRTLRRVEANVVYGTVRVIERDHDARLAWARRPWACVVLNLHVDHNPDGFAGARRAFRDAADVALEHGGSFYLTYHDWATAEQLRAGHPAIEAALTESDRVDPGPVFASDWRSSMNARLGR